MADTYATRPSQNPHPTTVIANIVYEAKYGGFPELDIQQHLEETVNIIYKGGEPLLGRR
jgi:hypothetical protein